MLDSIRGHARALASLRPARILHLSGLLRDSGEPVTALYAGNGANLEFITSTVFTAAPSQRQIQKVSPLCLSGAITRAHLPADLIVTERPPLWALLGGKRGEVRIPAWVRQELYLQPQASQRWTLNRHLEKEVQRQIRRHDYRLEISAAAADKDEFFTHFYQPYISSRHGSGAITVDKGTFVRLARSATLAKLFAGSTWTAGMLLQQRVDTLRFGWFGSRQDPPSPGASEVLDTLCIKMAAAQGIHRINLGNSRPSLKDGVVRYKRKFGAQFVLPRYPQVVIELQLTSDRSALRNWLTSQKFLCNHRHTLAIVEYSDSLSDRLEFKPVAAP